MTVMKSWLGKQWHVLEVTTPYSDLLVITTVLSLPQLKTQTHEASISALQFVEDAKANYVGGFLRGEDDSVFSGDKPSALLYEADSNSKPRSGQDLRRPP